jgi:hypothetical protein
MGVLVGCAVGVSAIAACTLASMSGAGVPPQAVISGLNSIRRVGSCFTASHLLVCRDDHTDA